MLVSCARDTAHTIALRSQQQPDAPATRTRRLPTAVAAVALAATACSTLPDPHVPPHVDWTFRASYTVDGSGRLALPSSTREVVIAQLDLNPEPIAERFADGRRWFVYPSGTNVDVHGRVRLYRAADGHQPTLQDVLPGATLSAAAAKR